MHYLDLINPTSWATKNIAATSIYITMIPAHRIWQASSIALWHRLVLNSYSNEMLKLRIGLVCHCPLLNNSRVLHRKYSMARPISSRIVEKSYWRRMLSEIQDIAAEVQVWSSALPEMLRSWSRTIDVLLLMKVAIQQLCRSTFVQINTIKVLVWRRIDKLDVEKDEWRCVCVCVCVCV